mmetsp:Transcript_17106/g.23793  ORF Transcript_17106/g.23793 Transcript_17106/m.23793 type:complete len:345 (-) Transcript_17106:31-1065(-)
MDNTKIVRVNTQTVLQKISDGLEQLVQIRHTIRKLFRIVTSNKDAEQIKHELKLAIELMKKLSALGKEVEGFLKTVPISHQIHELIGSRGRKLNNQVFYENNHFKDISERSELALLSWTRQLGQSSMTSLKRKAFYEDMDEIIPKRPKTLYKLHLVHRLEKNFPLMTQMLASKMDLDSVLAAMQSAKIQLTFNVEKLANTTSNLQVAKMSCSKVFLAYVSFHEGNGEPEEGSSGLKLCNVSVFGFGEKNGSPGDYSKHLTFRKITFHAMEATKYFRVFSPGFEMEELLLWLNSYANLFTADCLFCGKHLRFEPSVGFVPPLFRTFNTGQPYHTACFARKAETNQ